MSQRRHNRNLPYFVASERPEPRFSDQSSRTTKKTGFLAIVIIALIASGGLFLLTWDIPPPTASVEKVLPDDRFPR